MPRRATISIPVGDRNTPGRFTGIDRRNLQTGANPNSLYDAANVDLTIGGELRRRDGLIEHASLPAGRTIGLYSVGGRLRVAGPSGYDTSLQMPVDITLDEFGDQEETAVDLDRYVRVSDYTSWGASPINGAQPYLILETAGGQFLHHWIDRRPASFNTPVKTIVQVGFDSGPSLEKIQGKIFAYNKFLGTVHFCSTEFGAGVWRESDAPGDAGFISPLEHADSDPQISGIMRHQGNLLVVYDDAVQIWQVDPNPANMAFLTSYRGPGTKVFESFQPVIGDVFYFSEGGFRSLATQTVTGELRQGDLGSPIEPLTIPFKDVPNGQVRALWSQARSQYICLFNDEETNTAEVFVYTHVPTFGIGGWTRWTLPINVEYIVEHDEQLYIRSGDTIYRFEPSHCWDTIDGVQNDVTGDVITQYVTGGRPRQAKQWKTMDVTQEGISDISMLPDQRDRSIEVPLAFGLDGSSHDLGHIPLTAFGHAVALRFKAKLLWELDGFDLDLTILDGG